MKITIVTANEIIRCLLHSPSVTIGENIEGEKIIIDDYHANYKQGRCWFYYKDVEVLACRLTDNFYLY